MAQISNKEVAGGGGIAGALQIMNDLMVNQLSLFSAPLTDTFKLHLMTGAGPFSPSTVLADLVEATFDGYATVSLDQTPGPGVDGSGNGLADYPLGEFLCTGDTTPEQITGCYITSTINGVIDSLAAVAEFATAAPMLDTGDQVKVHLLWSLGKSLPLV